ncbi:MAG: hypothetical protein AB7O44_04215 [Hyphomicrobiaceae bacterium]|jgi:hypothetical protein
MTDSFDPRAAAGRVAGSVRHTAGQLKASGVGRQLSHIWPLALGLAVAVGFLGLLFIGDWRSP